MKEEYYKDFMSNSDIDINRKIHYRKGLTKKKIVVSGNTLFYRNDVYYEINSHHELFCNLFSKLENSFDKYEDLFKKYMKSAFSGDYEQTDAHYIELIQILKDLHPFFNAGDNAKHYIQMHIAAFFWITFENFLKISYSKNNDIDDVLKTFNDKFLLSMAPTVISTKITRPQILNINIYNKVPSKKESSLHDVTCKMISFVKHYTLPRRFSYDNETTHKALDILQIKHEKSSEDFEDYIVKQINFKIRRYDEMTDTDKVAAIDKLVDLLNLSRKKYQSFEEKVTMVDELFQLLHPKATSKNLYNIFSSHIHVFFDHSPSPSKYKSYDELIDSYRFFDDLYRLKNTLAYYVHTFSDFMVDNRKLSSSQITAYFLDCLEIKDLCTALNKLSTVSTPFNMLNLLEMHPYEVDSRFSDGMVHVYERKSKVLEYLGYGDSISKLSDLYVNNPQNKDRILKDIKKRYDTVLRDTPEDFFNSVIYSRAKRINLSTVNDILLHADLIAEDNFPRYLNKCYGTGAFVKKTEAQKIIESSQYKAPTKEIMCAMLNCCMQKRNLHIVSEIFSKKTYETLLKRFNTLGISPITIDSKNPLQRFEAPLYYIKNYNATTSKHNKAVKNT